jgi:hypothetical protein
MTYNGTTAAIYLDGASEASGARTVNTALRGTGSIARWVDSNLYFNGSISGVEVYSKALTAGEVSTLFTGGVVSTAKPNACSYALKLLGSNSYAYFNPYLLPIGSQARSLCCWLKTQSTASDADVFGYGYSDNGRRFNLWLSNGMLTSEGYGSGYGIASTTYVNSNIWTHVALTYDGTTSILYVNGSQVASGVTSTLNTAVSYGYFGGLGNNYNLQGFLSDCIIANYAMTSSEISAIYHGTA